MKGGQQKGSGKTGGKKGGKVPPSNLSIADRKAKLAELKDRSHWRCGRCGAIGHWAGDAECRLKGSPAGSKSGSGKGGSGAEKGATPGKSGAASASQAHLAALSDTSDDEVPAIHLSNAAEDMEGYPAAPGEPVPVPGPSWVLPTSGLQETGKRPGSSFAIEVEGLKRRPPSVGGGLGRV